MSESIFKMTNRKEVVFMSKLKIKLIAISLLSIAILIVVITGFSGALYQDVEVIEPTIMMGSLKLKVGDEIPANVPLHFDNMLPGELEKISFMVDNIGSLEGNFWVRGEIVESNNDGLLNCARLSLVYIRPNGSPYPIINHNLLINIVDDFDTEPHTEADDLVNNGPVEMQVWVSTDGCGSENMGDYLKARLSLYLTQIIEE
jgi:hypothetical protein